MLDRNPTHPGTKRLRPFVEKSGNPTRSPLEDDFEAFCKRYGLPTPVTDIYLLGYEIDALFPVERVIVELDGRRFHGTRSSAIVTGTRICWPPTTRRSGLRANG